MSEKTENPMLSFIIPVQDGENSQTVERINIAFHLAKNYGGFSEIITVIDGADHKTCKITWLAIKFNKTSTPHVRTAITYHASTHGLAEAIKTGISRAIGEKIIILLNQNNNVEHIKNIPELNNGFQIIEDLTEIEKLNDIFLNKKSQNHQDKN
ncbi:MAG: hypothetical protein QXG39_08945 [Candidatus Aenigmatarchaeota archaeon]